MEEEGGEIDKHDNKQKQNKKKGDKKEKKIHNWNHETRENDVKEIPEKSS